MVTAKGRETPVVVCVVTASQLVPLCCSGFCAGSNQPYCPSFGTVLVNALKGIDSCFSSPSQQKEMGTFDLHSSHLLSHPLSFPPFPLSPAPIPSYPSPSPPLPPPQPLPSLPYFLCVTGLVPTRLCYSLMFPHLCTIICAYSCMCVCLCVCLSVLPPYSCILCMTVHVCTCVCVCVFP